MMLAETQARRGLHAINDLLCEAATSAFWATPSTINIYVIARSTWLPRIPMRVIILAGSIQEWSVWNSWHLGRGSHGDRGRGSLERNCVALKATGNYDGALKGRRLWFGAIQQQLTH
jgi:hypothetical protein